MNDHDVIDHLRAALDDVHHERPLAQVARRARVIRAHRRAPRGIAAALAVAAAITLGVNVGTPSDAFADWTSQPEPADPSVAAAIDDSCRLTLDGSARAGDELLLLDVRGQHAVALYRTQTGEVWSCSRFQGDGRPGDSSWWFAGGRNGPNPVAAPTTGQPVVLAGVSTSWGVQTGGMTSVSGRVLEGAVRVEVRVPGYTVTAALADGHFEAWWPATSDDPSNAVISAYDDGGAVLATITTEVSGVAL